MTERPILFSAPMVLALLAGTKTQTRRTLKQQPIDILPMPYAKGREWITLEQREPDPKGRVCRCRYGLPDDRLWVRESWQFADWTEDGYPFIRYRADGKQKLHERIPDDSWGERLTDIWAELSDPENYEIDGRAADRRWRPSIHMPRWASRITLRITDVHVERLQDISEADCIAEGTPMSLEGTIPQEFGIARRMYRKLWESINGSGSWDANPWVWVVSFELPQRNEHG